MRLKNEGMDEVLNQFSGLLAFRVGACMALHTCSHKFIGG